MSLKYVDSSDIIKQIIATREGAEKIAAAMRRPLELRIAYECLSQHAYTMLDHPIDGDDVVVAEYISNPEIPKNLIAEGRNGLVERAQDLAKAQITTALAADLLKELDARSEASGIPNLDSLFSEESTTGVCLTGAKGVAILSRMSEYKPPIVVEGGRQTNPFGTYKGREIVASRLINELSVYVLDQPNGEMHLRVDVVLEKYGETVGYKVTATTRIRYRPGWTACRYTLG